jgi:hypothetical protein
MESARPACEIILKGVWIFVSIKTKGLEKKGADDMVKPMQDMQTISEDMLESINGGVISEKGKRVLITQVIEPAKESGHSKEKTISYTLERLPQIAGSDYTLWADTTEEEIVDFINRYWEVY